MEDASFTKKLVFADFSEIRREAKHKEHVYKKKVLAQTDEWDQYILANLSPNAQKHATDEALRTLDMIVSTPEPAYRVARILVRQIKIKQAGYRAQDTAKGLLDIEMFIGIKDILEKLQRSELRCFYCREHTHVFYEYCRDPKQWTLERIDNSFGHNRDNVEIACLQCNVKRRTMFYERYQMTKQCVITKQDA